MKTLSVRRYLGALAATVLLVSLAGCGDSDTLDEESSTETGAVLDQATLRDALLTVDDLPDGYAEPDDDDDDDFETGTCFDDLAGYGDREDARPEEEATLEFTATGSEGESGISPSAESYADEATVTAAVDQFVELARSCPKVVGEADGLAYDLRITAGDKVTLDGADHQANVLVEGSIGAAGQTFPVTFGYVIASIGNNLAAVGSYDVGEVLGDTAADQIERLAQAQLDRVADLT